MIQTGGPGHFVCGGAPHPTCRLVLNNIDQSRRALIVVDVAGMQRM